jgi:hypothetical protein
LTADLASQWKLARETVSIDSLTGGRLILGVGLGYPAELEFAALGEEPDDRIRTEKLDEGLEVLTGLWSGEPFSFRGEHLRVEDVQFLPTPVQQPRIPIWVAQMVLAPPGCRSERGRFQSCATRSRRGPRSSSGVSLTTRRVVARPWSRATGHWADLGPLAGPSVLA